MTETESAQSIGQAIEGTGEGPEARGAAEEATGWLTDYLEVAGADGVDSAAVRTAAHERGLSYYALKQAKRRLGVVTENVGYPRRTTWRLLQSGRIPGEPAPSTQPSPPDSSQDGQVDSQTLPTGIDPTDATRENDPVMLQAELSGASASRADERIPFRMTAITHVGHDWSQTAR